MAFDKAYIHKLLSLYEEGESTLEQEEELRTYFSSEAYDSEFEVYAMMFQSLKEESKVKSPSPSRTSRKPDSKIWLNIAASVCIILGALWLYKYNVNQQELEEAKLAFEKTQHALNLMSIHMNEGLEQLEYVEVFSEQKDKILK